LAGVSVYTAPEEMTGGNQLELALRRIAAVRTDAGGLFTLPNLRSGRYRVNAGGTDLLSSGPSTHAVVRKSGVDVVEGATADAGTLELPQGGRIEGTVSDTQGAALASASVFL